MKAHIIGFPEQLKNAFSIAQKAELTPSSKNVDNVIICGIGGSGIGGKIVANIFEAGSRVPIATCNEYDLPGFAGENTLIIASSYSGNTEEVLSMIGQAREKGCEIACITSGGKLGELAVNEGLNCITVPGGNPPRSCLGYSVTQILRLLENYEVIPNKSVDEITQAASLLVELQDEIVAEAKQIATVLDGKIPVIYSSKVYEPLAVRFCQQLNENSKMLAWNSKIPEMNHNEIVGWAKNYDQVAALFLDCEHDFYRTKARMEFTKKVVREKASATYELKCKGESALIRTIYYNNVLDWVSVILAENNGIDPIEIKVIDALKKELAVLK